MTAAELLARRNQSGVVEGQLASLWGERIYLAGRVRYLEAQLALLEKFQALVGAIRWCPNLAAQVEAVAPAEWKAVTEWHDVDQVCGES